MKLRLCKGEVRYRLSVEEANLLLRLGSMEEKVGSLIFSLKVGPQPAFLWIENKLAFQVPKSEVVRVLSTSNKVQMHCCYMFEAMGEPINACFEVDYLSAKNLQLEPESEAQ